MLRIALIALLSLFITTTSVFAQASGDAVKQLDELGLNYSADALIASAKANDLRAVDLFMAAGMNPDVTDSSGAPALIYAAQDGYMLIAESLLQYGANVNAVDPANGKTALYYAVESEDLQMTRLLLKYGANPNIPGPHGMTPLMLASQEGDVALVRLLVQGGANIFAQADNGWTPIIFASQAGNEEVVQILESWYGDTNPGPGLAPPVAGQRSSEIRLRIVPQ
jgi:ankyrin repeat protein